ncbi:Hypothetical protein D9617_4g001740 [Elsinoe fawcettii]|nr:Hypothetical protein D9617_4g001740 [Elsinoe fawcettii]
MYVQVVTALLSLSSLASASCSSFRTTNTTLRVPGPNITISDDVWCAGPQNCSINSPLSTTPGTQEINTRTGGIGTDRATLNLTLPANETNHVLRLISNATDTPFYAIMQHNITTILGVTLPPGQGGWTVFMVRHTCVTGTLEGCGAGDPENGTVVTGCTSTAPPQGNCAYDRNFHCMNGIITWNYADEQASRAQRCESCADNTTTDQTKLVTETTGDGTSGAAGRQSVSILFIAFVLGLCAWLQL